MKSLPRWLSERYSILFVNKGDDLFRFEEGQRILNLSQTLTLKTFSELAKSGALIIKRDPVDERQKIYKLVSPTDFHFAGGVQASLPRRALLLDKIKHMGKHLDYLVTGEYATLLHTRYVYPRVMEIKVRDEDYEKWYAYLRGSRTFVALEPTYVKQLKRYRNVVNLLYGLTEEEFREKSEIDGLFVEAPERLILNFIKEQSEASLSNTLAIAVAKRDQINWEKLAEKSREVDLNRQTGCLLEILNIEAKKNAFPSSVIEMFLPRVKQPKSTFSAYYATKVNELQTKLRDRFIAENEKQIAAEELDYLTSKYEMIEEKWCLEIFLPPHVPRKIAEDLVH